MENIDDVIRSVVEKIVTDFVIEDTYLRTYYGSLSSTLSDPCKCADDPEDLMTYEEVSKGWEWDSIEDVEHQLEVLADDFWQRDDDWNPDDWEEDEQKRHATMTAFFEKFDDDPKSFEPFIKEAVQKHSKEILDELQEGYNDYRESAKDYEHDQKAKDNLDTVWTEAYQDAECSLDDLFPVSLS